MRHVLLVLLTTAAAITLTINTPTASAQDTPPPLSPPTTTPTPPATTAVPVFSCVGTWGAHTRCTVTVCNGGDRSIVVMGNFIWAYAQRHGLSPMTQSQLQEEAALSSRWTPASILRTTGLALAGITTSLQASNVIGEEWEARYKAIAPVVGIGLVAAELIAQRQQRPPLEMPVDYLPSRMDIQPMDCQVATLICADQSRTE
jgi:hypothetical protein